MRSTGERWSPGPLVELPLPDTLRDVVRHRLLSLPAAERELLLAVAALLTADARAARQGPRRERRSVVDGQGDPRRRSWSSIRDESASPTRCSARSSMRTPAQARRKKLHRRLADVVGDPEESARHLALAADGPDSGVAAKLDAAAADSSRPRRTGSRGGAPDAGDRTDTRRRPARAPPASHRGRLLDRRRRRSPRRSAARKRDRGLPSGQRASGGSRAIGLDPLPQRRLPGRRRPLRGSGRRSGDRADGAYFDREGPRLGRPDARRPRRGGDARAQRRRPGRADRGTDDHGRQPGRPRVHRDAERPASVPADDGPRARRWRARPWRTMGRARWLERRARLAQRDGARLDRPARRVTDESCWNSSRKRSNPATSTCFRTF